MSFWSYFFVFALYAQTPRIAIQRAILCILCERDLYEWGLNKLQVLSIICFKDAITPFGKILYIVQDANLIKKLIDLGQEKIFKEWPSPGQSHSILFPQNFIQYLKQSSNSKAICFCYLDWL